MFMNDLLFELPKIKINDLENPFYSINGTPHEMVKLCFMDFKIDSEPPTIDIFNPNVIGPQIYEKYISWKTLSIPKHFTKDNLIDFFNNEFIKIAKPLGDIFEKA